MASLTYACFIPAKGLIRGLSANSSNITFEVPLASYLHEKRMLGNNLWAQLNLLLITGRELWTVYFVPLLEVGGTLESFKLGIQLLNLLYTNFTENIPLLYTFKYWTKEPLSHTFTNIDFYYPTALRRVQITLKTSKNITQYLYSRGPVRQVSCHWPIS